MTPRQRRLVESAQRQLGGNRRSEVQAAKKAVEPEPAPLASAHHCNNCGRHLQRGNRDGEAIAWCPVCEPHFNREKALRKAARSLEAVLRRKRGSA